MKLSMTYCVRTKGFNRVFDETVRLYRQAVSFFVAVCLKEWKYISVIQGQKRELPVIGRIRLIR